MWNRVLTTFSLLIVAILGLNFYIGMALSNIIEEDLTKASQQWQQKHHFKLGSVSSSPFRGNITLHDIRYEQSQTETSVKLKSFFIDLSYVDFLKLYFKGPVDGLSAITSTRLQLDEVNVTGISKLPGFSAASAQVVYAGNLVHLLRLSQSGQLPSSSVRLSTTMQGLTFSLPASSDEPIQADTFKSSITFESGFSTLLIDHIEISGPSFRVKSEGQLIFDSTAKSLTALNRYELKTNIRYEKNTQPITVFSNSWGTLRTGFLDINADITQSFNQKDHRFSNLVQATGMADIKLKQLEYTPTPFMRNQYQFILPVFSHSADGAVSFDQFTLQAAATNQTITVKNTRLSLQPFDITASGDIIKHKKYFNKSLLNNAVIRIENITAEQQAFFNNLAAILGMNTASHGGSIEIELVGTLANPRISP